MATTKGAWKLQEVRDQILASKWVQYNTSADPGTLWAWGSNADGRMGDDTVIPKSSPVQIPGTTWTRLGAMTGSCHMLATKSDGTLWSWGQASYGQLGISCLIHRSSPVQVPGTQWSTANVMEGHTVALKTDGTLWSFGCGSYGRLGDGTIIPRSSPIQIPGTTWSKATGGRSFTFATKTDGTLWAWGFNCVGNLGISNTIHRSSPVQIPGTQWSDVCAGRESSIALKTDGTMWSWGRNDEGQLGHNTYCGIGGICSPFQIPGTSWNDIAMTSCEGMARKTDGTLWVWGRNGDGQLGVNNTVHRSSPVQVPGTQWVSMSGAHAGSIHALKTDGTLWGMGNGSRLGNSSNTPSSSPIQIPGTQWSDIGHLQAGAFARKA